MKNSTKNAIRFRTKILTAGKTTTGIRIPDEIIEQLGGGKKPAVCVTIHGYTYRSTVAVMGGRFMVGVNAENRENLALDTEPREVEVPKDFAMALNRSAKARKYFDGLSYSKRKAFAQSIEGAKTAETRQRRIEKAVSELGDAAGTNQ